MIILGVTGSIGMGKSTLTRMLRDQKIPVHDADAAVHRLLAAGGKAVAAIEAAFPAVSQPSGGIDRRALGQRVFGDTPALRRLEAILHPLVRADKAAFLARCRRRRCRLVALDVPLLFETGGDKGCDAVMVVSAPYFLQRQRVLARPGMTEETFVHIVARQYPDAKKRQRADYVIPSGLGKAVTRRRVKQAVRAVLMGHLKKVCHA